MSSSLITKLYYASPYASLPPGISIAGVTLQTDSKQSPPPPPPTVSNLILATRLRMASNSAYVLGFSPTSGPAASVMNATVQLGFPLSAIDSYMLDAIWVPLRTSPDNIDWNAAIFSAPVTAAEVSVSGASFDGTSLTAQLVYGPSGIGVGAQVTVYSLSGGVYVKVGSQQTQSNTVIVPVDSNGYPSVYFISAQAAIPTTNAGGAGSFAAPFSLGPPTNITPLSGIPQAVKTLQSATYNSGTLVFSWVLDTIEGCVSPHSSLIQILSGGQVISSYTGGPLAAILPLEVSDQTGITISVSAVSNNIRSKPLSFSLITVAPTVADVTADKSTGKVTANVSAATGLIVQGSLMNGDQLLAGPVTAANNIISFDYSTADYNVEGMVGLSVVAWATSSDGSIAGPQSSPAVLLATTPALQFADIFSDPADSTKWCINLAWNRLPDAIESVTSYTVNLLQDGTSITKETLAGTAATLSVSKTDIDPAKTQTIQLSATGSTGGASPAQILYAAFAAPILAALTATPYLLTCTWTAPQLPSGNTLPVLYQPVIISNGTIIYRGRQTAATTAAILLSEIAVSDSGSISAMVSIALGPVALQPDTGMPAGTSATPILTTPVITPVTANPVSNITTLNWTAIDGATAYTLHFTDGTSQEGISTNSYVLPQTPVVGEQLGYTVQATGSQNSVAITGPASPLVFIPTNSVRISQVRFDGSNGSITWDAIAGALRYNASVYDDQSNNVVSESTSNTAVSFSFTPVAGRTYTAYVQPVMSRGSGLSGAQPVFTPGIFVSQQPSATAFPYVYTAQSMAAIGSSISNPAAQLIVLYLPELGREAGALGTAPITVDPFTIEPTGQAGLPYKLTIAASTLVWTFDTTQIRLQLQAAYVSFLKKMEQPPAGSSGATPYGISLVQAAIACALPQTFAELLYYNFGFSTFSSVGSGYIDLRPGMILRVTAGDYVSIMQNQLPSWLNGYAGAAIMDFEIGSYSAGTSWRTGFDSFLNTLAAKGVLTVSAPATSTGNVQAGVAGAVDLYYPQFIQPFYRLYFPSAINIPWSIGANTTTSNFTLVAAASYTSLQSTSVDPSTMPTAYFRGRAIVSAMIKVLVNGAERLVSVGTTLGNLLEQLSLRPAVPSAFFNQLRVLRAITGAINNTNPADALGPQLELRLNWNGFPVYANGSGFDAMSIPLLPGDQIITNNSGS